ncbi:unnamed protein product [Ixodes hexagonus]
MFRHVSGKVRLGHVTCTYSTSATDSAFSEPNIQKCIAKLQATKLGTARPRSTDDSSRQRHSSVLIPLCTTQGNKPSILFTLRSTRLPRHKGYVCFPGGIQHPEDADPLETALRETEEELGLQRSKIKVMGTLPPFYNPGDRMFMTVVLGKLGQGRDLDLEESLNVNDEEVQLAFTRTLEELCDPANLRFTQFRRRHTDYSMPVFLVGQFKIWGLTAMVLNAFLKALLPGVYVHDVRCVLLDKKLYLKT